MLQANPKAEAIIGFNDEIAMGAFAAAKAQNRKLIITGTDGNKDALQAIKNGDLTMSIVFDLREAGRLAVETADAHLKGKQVQKRDRPADVLRHQGERRQVHSLTRVSAMDERQAGPVLELV